MFYPELTNEEKLRAALGTVLDQVDYTAGACRPIEMVAAVLPVDVINMAKGVLAETSAEERRGDPI